MQSPRMNSGCYGLRRRNLTAIRGVQIIGTAAHKAAVRVLQPCRALHPHDIGTILDHEGVANPHRATIAPCRVMDFLRRAGTAACLVRLPYSTSADVTRLIAAVERVREVFA